MDISEGLHPKPNDADTAKDKPLTETTEQQVARLVAIPFDQLEADQLIEITMLADMMVYRSQHWQMVARQLQHESEDSAAESNRIQKLADALHAAAEYLAKAKNAP